MISSPYGAGRVQHILQVIAAYEQDFARLRSYSDRYPSPEVLRALCKQGAVDGADASGVGKATAGSQWIIECARRQDPRPLHVLVWGGIEDLAQALHDAPDILPKLRVHFIGGPNKKWSVDAYNYIEQNHPNLWIIEANATYRGWFVGGNQQSEWGNQEFVTKHIVGHGALGKVFFDAKADIKMGDTPTVARLLRGVSDDPTKASWGGSYVPIWDGRKTVFPRMTSESDTTEVFGVTEFALPLPRGFSNRNHAKIVFEGTVPSSLGAIDGEVLRFRFSPRDVKSGDTPSRAMPRSLMANQARLTRYRLPIHGQACGRRSILTGGSTILIQRLPKVFIQEPKVLTDGASSSYETLPSGWIAVDSRYVRLGLTILMVEAGRYH